MSEENNNQPAGAAEGLREVPADLVEYKKFVAAGGHEHNAKIRGREEAEKAARDAGLHLAERDEQHKPHKNGFQARINRLQRKIGERDQRIADLERGASAGTNGQPAPAKPDAATPAREATERNGAAKPAAEDKTPPRPVEKDFKTYSEFVEALTDWKTDRKLEAAEAKRSETRQLSEAEKQQRAVIDAHNARVDEAKTRYDDWGTVFDGLTGDSFSDAMTVFLFESEKGPDVTYYLATHRDELKRIRALSPLRQAAALEKIEDRLSDDEPDNPDEGEDKGAGEKPAKPAKTAKPVTPADDDEEDDEEEKKPAARPRSAQSKAPAPAKPLGGKGGADDAMPDPTDFVAYEKWSRRQQAKAKAR